MTQAQNEKSSRETRNEIETTAAAALKSERRPVVRPTIPDVVLASDQGRTTISSDVVAKIAGLAVREVAGIHNLVPYGTSQSLSSLAASVTGREMRDLGVRVQVGTIEAAIHCRVICEYGASIPEVTRRVRENVVSRVQRGTGLRVKQVNIEVVDLYFGEEHPVEDQPSDELVLQ